MKVGYARVSSKAQNLERQLEILQNENVEKVFSEKIQGDNPNRPALNEMLNYIRDGDIVVVTELDRLARDNDLLTDIIAAIHKKGATLDVLNLPTLKGISDDNLRRLINNLIIEIYKYQAEADRMRIRERQAQGIEIAKKKGKFKGRQHKFKENDPRLKHAFDLFLNGLSDKEVEEQTGINRRTFRRYRARYNVTVDQRKNNEKRDS